MGEDSNGINRAAILCWVVHYLGRERIREITKEWVSPEANGEGLFSWKNGLKASLAARRDFEKEEVTKVRRKIDKGFPSSKDKKKSEMKIEGFQQQKREEGDLAVQRIFFFPNAILQEDDANFLRGERRSLAR